MKKVITIILCTLLTLPLFACGGNQTVDKHKAKPAEISTETVTNKPDRTSPELTPSAVSMPSPNPMLESSPESTSDMNTSVVFHDADFETAFREANNITGIITMDMILEVTELYLCEPNPKLEDITDVAMFKNLTSLFLNSNSISDISPLSELVNLTELQIALNQISNLNPLSGLTNLTMLELEENDLNDSTDLSALYNLTKLEHLFIKNGNDLTQEQIDAIQEHLPNVYIY